MRFIMQDALKERLYEYNDRPSAKTIGRLLKHLSKEDRTLYSYIISETETQTVMDAEYGRSIHIVKEWLYDISLTDLTNDEIQLIDDTLTILEFQFQYLNLKPQHQNQHRWWFENPACTCDTYENIALLGNNANVISNVCKMHGLKRHKPALKTWA